MNIFKLTCSFFDLNKCIKASNLKILALINDTNSSIYLNLNFLPKHQKSLCMFRLSALVRDVFRSLPLSLFSLHKFYLNLKSVKENAK